MPGVESPSPQPGSASTPRSASTSSRLASSLNPNERRIVALTSVGHALCHSSELVFSGILVTLINEFHLQPDQATLLGLAGFILLGLGAVPAGLWTDRWSSRGVLTVYFFSLALAAALLTLAHTALALAAGLTFLGAAISLYHPASLAMIAHGCRFRGRAMGINGVAGNIGIACGPALGAWMAALGHWRLAYALIALVGLLAALAMTLFRIDESPADPHPAPESLPPTHHSPLTTHSSGPSSLITHHSSLASGRLWLLYAAMFLGGLNYRSLVTALPAYLSGPSATAATVSKGGLLTFFILVAGGIGQFLGGHATDRTAPSRLYIFLIAMTIPLALLMAHTGLPAAAVAAALLAVFMFAQQPVENTMLAHATSPHNRSTLYGVKFVFSFGLGALGAQMVGIIWRHTGSPAPAFDLFALTACLMALCAFFFRLSHTRPAAQPLVPDPLPT